MAHSSVSAVVSLSLGRMTLANPYISNSGGATVTKFGQNADLLRGISGD